VAQHIEPERSGDLAGVSAVPVDPPSRSVDISKVPARRHRVSGFEAAVGIAGLRVESIDWHQRTDGAGAGWSRDRARKDSSGDGSRHAVTVRTGQLKVPSRARAGQPDGGAVIERERAAGSGTLCEHPRFDQIEEHRERIRTRPPCNGARRVDDEDARSSSQRHRTGVTGRTAWVYVRGTTGRGIGRGALSTRRGYAHHGDRRKQHGTHAESHHAGDSSAHLPDRQT